MITDVEPAALGGQIAQGSAGEPSDDGGGDRSRGLEFQSGGFSHLNDRARDVLPICGNDDVDLGVVFGAVSPNDRRLDDSSVKWVGDRFHTTENRRRPRL